MAVIYLPKLVTFTSTIVSYIVLFERNEYQIILIAVADRYSVHIWY